MSFSREEKRMKGDFACAECRRLKTRCDKQVPCSTCIRRGCEVLCPNSTMPPGGGSRFVGVAEEFLRRKIAKMEERMRSLEDALAIIQGSVSHKPYLLLNEKLPNEDCEVEWVPKVDRVLITENEFNKYGLDDLLGALYLDDGPPSDLASLGTSDSSKSVLHQAKVFITESSSLTNHTEEINSSYLPSEICVLHQAFPFTPTGIPTKAIQDLIESYLPPLSRAIALCETFLHSMSWMFSVVSRQHILGDLIPTVYGRANDLTQPKSYGPHDVALLFVLFAIGALVDPSLPPYNVEGQHYHILSRAALSLQPVFAQRSVVTIKTLHLMSVYNGMCGIDGKLDSSQSLLSMAGQIALQIGFHKDPSVWGITGREAYERRTYFWNLLCGTLWQSLIAGQPPVIIPSWIHSQIPTKEEEDMYQLGEVPLGFGIWSFSFTLECIVPVVEATQAAQPPSYDTILALDSKIREFLVPNALNNGGLSGQMQSFARNHLRELTLLFLHRGFFVQALADFPWDPLRSPLRQSFLTAYHSATRVLSSSRKQLASEPALCARVFRIWTFAFCAAIIVATVAIKRLTVKLEPEPFGQLDLACTLFREAAQTSIRAQKALPILLRMRREAMQIQPGTLPRESGRASSPLEGDHHQGARGGHELSLDSSIRAAHYPTPSTPCSGAPISQYMPALPPPVVHPPLARIVESDQEPHAGAPPEWQGPYREIRSWTSVGSHGLPSATPYASHPPASVHGVTPESRGTSSMRDRTGTHMHSYSS